MKNLVKAYWKTLLFFVVVGLVGGFFVGLYMLDSYPEELCQQAAEQGLNDVLIGLITAVQSAGYGLVLGALGILLGKKVGLWRGERHIARGPLLAALAISVIGGLALILPDLLIFGKFEPVLLDAYAAKPTIPYLLATVTYGAVIEEVMPGCIVDRGVTDANNMGAAMAPSAADTLERYFKGSGRTPDSFDLIVTGDLGREGTAILRDLLEVKGIDITKHHVDCGCMIFSETESDTHAGGSGCGCSAVVLAADLLPNLCRGVLRDILFVGTGALMNPLSLNQGQPIPGIAHLIRIRAIPKREFSHKITEEISHADAP